MAAVTTGTILLADVRARAAAALAPASSDDPEVIVDVVDALSPPALLLLWSDPWLTPRTIGSCYFDAQFEVLAVASRVEPGPGLAKLEELVSYTIDRLQADDYSWPPLTLYAPRRFEIGNITYLGARLVFRVPVTV
jgi:hypothetical protein